MGHDSNPFGSNFTVHLNQSIWIYGKLRIPGRISNKWGQLLFLPKKVTVPFFAANLGSKLTDQDQAVQQDDNIQSLLVRRLRYMEQVSFSGGLK